jgi:hypothetical protein
MGRLVIAGVGYVSVQNEYGHLPVLNIWCAQYASTSYISHFVRNVVGKSRVANGPIVCSTMNGFPLGSGFRALPMSELSINLP